VLGDPAVRHGKSLCDTNAGTVCSEYVTMAGFEWATQHALCDPAIPDRLLNFNDDAGSV